MPKWTELEFGDSPDDRFDLGHFYKNRGGDWRGLMFIAHEMFHGTQGSMIPLYDTPGSHWLAESTAEFGADIAFAAAEKILAGFTTAPAYPLGLQAERDKDRGDHFFTEAVSLHGAVRGGHTYASWMVWWFLTEHAGIPGIVGQMYSLWSEYVSYRNGELLLMRILVERHNLDFGDVWGVFAAHLRTWDFPKFGENYAETEAEDWNTLLTNPDVQPPLPRVTLEQRKSQVELDGKFGTGGAERSGPSEYRPGPNGWNCITLRDVPVGRYVAIILRWDEGMGFAPNTDPPWLPNQHRGCDDDERFYNGMVVEHNEATGVRRYWKIKGKRPDTLHILVGEDGPVTIHILAVVTPPADYVIAHYKLLNNGLRRMSPIPMYSYKYAVSVTTTPVGTLRHEDPKDFGITRFATATPGFWPTSCTCINNPDQEPLECIRATFDSPISTRTPTVSPGPPLTAAPTPTSGAPGNGGGFNICFSGDNTVHTKDRGDVSMRDVRIGDRVLVRPGLYEAIYSFGHYHPTAMGEFVQLYTTTTTGKDRSPLELSFNHMVVLADGTVVPASAVRVGDALQAVVMDGTQNDNAIPTMTTAMTAATQVIVADIRMVIKSGVYAPFTPSGTVVVNGIVSSNYVAFETETDTVSSSSSSLSSSFTTTRTIRISSHYHVAGWKTPLTYQWMAHAFVSPHRLLCRTSEPVW